MYELRKIGLISSLVATALNILYIWVQWESNLLDIIYVIILVIGAIGGIICGSLGLWWKFTIQAFKCTIILEYYLVHLLLLSQ